MRIGPAAPATRWVEPLLGPYLERRLGELVPGTMASVMVQRNGVAEMPGSSREHSDRAIMSALGHQTDVYRRADGKPIVLGDREVSLSHAGDVLMSVAATGHVACDAEPVSPRTALRWQELLGPERFTLARLIVEESSDHLDAAATRLWAAGECLKKAGLSLDAPLVLRTTTPDGWVVLAVGSTTIATWIAPLRDNPEPLAMAMLVGNADAGL
jgi:enediyne polyketide synthase